MVLPLRVAPPPIQHNFTALLYCISFFAVSESMLVFLAAEAMAGQESLSEAELMKVMTDGAYRQQLGGSGRPQVPMSALSMEEQRLLQSLDRLNNKLQGGKGM